MKIVAIIQARMNSSRLPGKVLLEMLGKPVLHLMIERIQKAKNISKIVVATSNSKEDEKIASLCSKIGVGCFRGSEEDVLSRVALASKASQAELLVEFMADNPIPEPKLIDEFIDFFKAHDYDLVTNSLKTTFTPGLELCVLKPEIIYEADRLVLNPEEREHVFLYIMRHPEKYKIYNFPVSEDYNYPNIHMELDTEEDFQVIKNIYEHFYPHNKDFSSREAIFYLKDNPGIVNINKNIARRWQKYRVNS